MGEPVVYLASSLALAVLGTWVHLEAVAIQQPYVVLEYKLPEGIEDLGDELPEGWYWDVERTRELGSRCATMPSFSTATKAYYGEVVATALGRRSGMCLFVFLFGARMSPFVSWERGGGPWRLIP